MSRAASYVQLLPPLSTHTHYHDITPVSLSTFELVLCEVPVVSCSYAFLSSGFQLGKGLGGQRIRKNFSEIEQQAEQQQKEQGMCSWLISAHYWHCWPYMHC